MAAKKHAKPLTGSLFIDAALAPTEPAPPMVVAGAIPEAEDAREASRLRVVPPVEELPEEDVIIESTSDGRYVVSLLRHHGTTCAAVVYTRAQLGMLMRRIPPALEMGGG